jgi:hypothetical protein
MFVIILVFDRSDDFVFILTFCPTTAEVFKWRGWNRLNRLNILNGVKVFNRTFLCYTKPNLESYNSFSPLIFFKFDYSLKISTDLFVKLMLMSFSTTIHVNTNNAIKSNNIKGYIIKTKYRPVSYWSKSSIQLQAIESSPFTKTVS